MYISIAQSIDCPIKYLHYHKYTNQDNEKKEEK